MPDDMRRLPEAARAAVLALAATRSRVSPWTA